MKFKKISVIVLAIVMILSVMIPFVSAADKASELELAAEPDFAAHKSGLYTITAGQEITVTFAINVNSGIHALQFDIIFNPEVLDIVGKDDKGFINVYDAAAVLNGGLSADAFGVSPLKEIEPGRVQFTTIFDGITNFTGKLFSIKFKVAKIDHKECIIDFDKVVAYPKDSRDGALIDDDVKTNRLVLLAHNIGDVTVVAPECEKEGYSVVSCDCGFEFKFNEEPALGHKEEKIPAVEATFESEGLTEGIKCVRCGKILKAQEVIPKLEKDFNLLAQWWFWLIIALVVIAIVTIVVVIVTKKKKAGKKA